MRRQCRTRLEVGVCGVASAPREGMGDSLVLELTAAGVHTFLRKRTMTEATSRKIKSKKKGESGVEMVCAQNRGQGNVHTGSNDHDHDNVLTRSPAKVYIPHSHRYLNAKTNYLHEVQLPTPHGSSPSPHAHPLPLNP